MYKETETEVILFDMYERESSRRVTKRTTDGRTIGEASGWLSGNVHSYAYSCIIIYVLGTIEWRENRTDTERFASPPAPPPPP